MWRAEVADPRLRSNVTLLELLEPAPEWERLRAAHEWASRMVPRMRQRVVEPALGVGAPQLGDRRRAGPGPAPAAGPARRAGVDAPAARRRRRVRRGAARPGPPAVGGPARRGPRRRPRGVRRQDAPQHHRRPGRRPADEPAAQPDRRARPVPTGAARPAARRGLAASACSGPDRRDGEVAPAGGAAPGRGGTGQPAAPVGGRDSRPWTRSGRRRAPSPRRPAARRCSPRAAAGGTSRWRRCRSPTSRPGEGGGRSLNDGFLAAVVGGFRRYHERLGAGGDADPRHPDQPAGAGRPAGRQPVHRRALPGVAGRARPGHPYKAIRSSCCRRATRAVPGSSTTSSARCWAGCRHP